MREKKRREGAGAHEEGQGARGAWAKAEPDWVGPHRGTKTHDTHNHRSESNREMKSETRLSTHAIKHDIRQGNMPRHDATLMST
jgi:hypothetical protein